MNIKLAVTLLAATLALPISVLAAYYGELDTSYGIGPQTNVFDIGVMYCSGSHFAFPDPSGTIVFPRNTYFANVSHIEEASAMVYSSITSNSVTYFKGNGSGLTFNNAAGAAFRLVVNSTTNGFSFVPQ